jgi:arsenate reductase
MTSQIPRVLILGTDNSARSQMGEAILRYLTGPSVEVVSAGLRAGSMHPLAVEAMREVEIEMAGQRAKSVDEFRGQAFEAVVAVSDEARDACPAFAGRAAHVHYNIPDPAAVEGTPEERLEAFRRARDLLFSCLCEFFTVLVGPDEV